MLVHHVYTWDAHVFELQCSVVNTIHSKLNAHIVDGNTRHGLHVVVPHGYKESIYALVFAVNEGLAEHERGVGMLEAIRDPVLLGKDGGTVDHELFGGGIVGYLSLHLYGVVAKAKLGEAEAPTDRKVVDLIEKVLVPFGRKSLTSTAKEVHLDSELNGKTAIDHCHELVRGKNIVWIVGKVEDGDDFALKDLVHLAPWVVEERITVREVVGWFEDGVLEQVKPLGAFLDLVSEEDVG